MAGFATLAVNPFGGLMIAIPVGVLSLNYPVWWVLAVGIPLAYVQVIAVDALWSLLSRQAWWHRFLEARRSPRVQRLVAARGAFWLTVLLSPLLGPWLVMAFMRYAGVPQRKVALPILLGLLWNGSAIAAATAWLPGLVGVK